MAMIYVLNNILIFANELNKQLTFKIMSDVIPAKIRIVHFSLLTVSIVSHKQSLVMQTHMKILVNIGMPPGQVPI